MDHHDTDEFIGFQDKTYCLDCSDKLFIYECNKCFKNLVDDHGYDSDAYKAPELCPNCLKKEQHD